MSSAVHAPEPAASQRSADLLLGDLDALFGAVTVRLRHAAEGPGEAGGADDRLRADVLDCVGALEQLHTMLAHEVERRRRLEAMVDRAQATLARAPAELVAALGLTLRLPPHEYRSAADRAAVA